MRGLRVLAVASLTLFLAACGDDEEDPPAVEPAAVDEPEAQVPAADEPAPAAEEPAPAAVDETPADDADAAPADEPAADEPAPAGGDANDI